MFARGSSPSAVFLFDFVARMAADAGGCDVG